MAVVCFVEHGIKATSCRTWRHRLYASALDFDLLQNRKWYHCWSSLKCQAAQWCMILVFVSLYPKKWSSIWILLLIASPSDPRSNHAVVAGFQTRTLSMAMMSCWSYWVELSISILSIAARTDYRPVLGQINLLFTNTHGALQLHRAQKCLLDLSNIINERSQGCIAVHT